MEKLALVYYFKNSDGNIIIKKVYVKEIVFKKSYFMKILFQKTRILTNTYRILTKISFGQKVHDNKQIYFIENLVL